MPAVWRAWLLSLLVDLGMQIVHYNIEHNRTRRRSDTSVIGYVAHKIESSLLGIPDIHKRLMYSRY